MIMNFQNYFISYKELAKDLGVSYDTVRRKVAPRIIEQMKIDVNKLPKKALLPREVVEKYYDFSTK